MELLKKSLDQGKLIIVMTQCARGTVSDIYETGKVLISMGAILASDMTRETVLAKVSYLLGKNLSVDKVKLLMALNMKGELTEKIVTDNKE